MRPSTQRLSRLVLALLSSLVGADEAGNEYDFWTAASSSSVNLTGAGAVCLGADINLPASQLLRGRHLEIDEMEWAPFAMKNASTPLGWSGLDMDLLELLAVKLGFNYSIRDMVTPRASNPRLRLASPARAARAPFTGVHASFASGVSRGQ